MFDKQAVQSNRVNFIAEPYSSGFPHHSVRHSLIRHNRLRRGLSEQLADRTHDLSPLDKFEQEVEFRGNVKVFKGFVARTHHKIKITEKCITKIAAQ